MGRWTQYDEVKFAIIDEARVLTLLGFAQDKYRLPEGMTRIGYDANKAVYTFRDSSGKVYEGEPYSQYGLLKAVSHTRSGTSEGCESSNTIALFPSYSLQSRQISPVHISEQLQAFFACEPIPPLSDIIAAEKPHTVERDSRSRPHERSGHTPRRDLSQYEYKKPASVGTIKEASAGRRPEVRIAYLF